MKKSLFITLIFYLLFSNGFTQDTITIYYDKEWVEIPDMENAEFYRKAFPGEGRRWIVRDYFKSGKIQMDGVYRSKRIKMMHGHFTFYFENGKKESEGEYSYNNRQGNWTFWYESGVIRFKDVFEGEYLVSKEGYYENGNIEYSGRHRLGSRQGEWTFWTIEGKIAKKGKYSKGYRHGEWTMFFNDGTEMRVKYNRGRRLGEKEYGGVIIRGR